MRRLSRLLPLFGLLLIALASALLLGGCEKPQRLGGKRRPHYYRRVVSLSPSTTEILAGEGVRLMGRTASDDYPATVQRVPVVAGVKPDYEALAKVKPDLIVYDKALYSDADIAKLQTLNASLFEYDPRTFKEFQDQTYVLGSVTATETSTADYVSRVRQAAGSATGTGEGLKIAIVMPDKGGRHYVAGAKGFLSEVVGATGAKLVGPDGDRFVPLDPEFLIGQNPDVVIVAGDANLFANDARFANLAAMKTKAVFGLDPNIVLRRGGRVDVLIKNIAKAAGLAAASKGSANSGTLPK